jgi:hypothetical protein
VATSTVAVARRRRIHRRDDRARAFARDADSARARTPATGGTRARTNEKPQPFDRREAASPGALAR